MPGSERDVNINVTMTQETGPASSAAGRNIDQLQRKVDGFNTTKPTRQVKQFTDSLNASAKDGETAFETLQRVIGETETRIKTLRTQAKTSGSNASVFGDIKGAQNDLRTLEGFAKTLVPDFGSAGAKAGTEFTSSFGQQASALLPKALSNPVSAAVIAGVAVLAAPAIGALVGGAVTAGVGFGLLGIAAVVQKDNPVIQRAFGGLKDTAVSVFKDATQPLAQPFADALTDADLLIRKEGPQLKAVFSALAPSVEPIEKTFGHLLTDILPGATNLAKTFTTVMSDPTVQSSVDGIGKSLNALFNTIANNAPLIEHTFQAVARIVSGTVDIANGLVHAGAAVDQVFVSMFTSSQKSNVSFQQAYRSQLNFSSATDAATKAAQKHVDTLGSATAAEHDLFIATGQSANAIENDLNQSLSKVSTGVVTTANALDRNFTPAIIGSATAVEHGLTQSLAGMHEGVTTTANAVEAHFVPAVTSANVTLADTQAAARTAASAYGILSAAIQNNITAFDTVKRAEISAKQGLADLKASLKENGDNWNLNTQAGRNNETQLLNSLDSVKALYDAQVKNGGATYQNTAAYQKNVEQLLSLAKQAGASKSEIDALRKAYEDLPAEKTLTVHVKVAENAQSAQLLDRALGQHIAFTTADVLAPPRLGGGHDGAAAGGQWSIPPAQIDVESHLTTDVYVDGEFATRRAQRVVAQERRRQRVGVQR